MDWEARLADATGENVLTAGPHDLAAIKKAAAKLGLFTAAIAAKDAADKDALLAALGRALKFPDFFGGNFDALDDCLTDLSWLPGPGWVVLIEGELCPESPSDREVFLDVFNAASGSWREGSPRRNFKVVLVV